MNTFLLELASGVSDGAWKKPPDWCGPEPALYNSFDNPDGLILWEGTLQIGEIPLVSGKVMVQTYNTNITISCNHLCNRGKQNGYFHILSFRWVYVKDKLCIEYKSDQKTMG